MKKLFLTAAFLTISFNGVDLAKAAEGLVYVPWKNVQVGQEWTIVIHPTGYGFAGVHLSHSANKDLGCSYINSSNLAKLNKNGGVNFVFPKGNFQVQGEQLLSGIACFAQGDGKVKVSVMVAN